VGSAQNMGQLVQKLLVLARVDAAENTLHLVRLDGIVLAREIARDWAPQVLAKGLEIGFEATGGEAQVMGDAQLLREMLANLIDNALRYGGTRITLTVDGMGQEGVVWSVSDNGPGIPESQYAAAFAPFHRLSEGVDGAGLGLTIVQRIASLHGAKVSLGPSNMGPGLTVSVKFPPIPGGCQA